MRRYLNLLSRIKKYKSSFSTSFTMNRADDYLQRSKAYLLGLKNAYYGLEQRNRRLISRSAIMIFLLISLHLGTTWFLQAYTMMLTFNILNNLLSRLIQRYVYADPKYRPERQNDLFKKYCADSVALTSINYLRGLIPEWFSGGDIHINSIRIGCFITAMLVGSVCKAYYAKRMKVLSDKDVSNSIEDTKASQQKGIE